jgi:para-nitrobenzyl esterase
MRTVFAALALASTGLVAVALPAAAQQAPAPAQHYSVQTTQVGTLLDDPRTKAILERMIPTIYANEMFQTMGRSQTLKGVQQYEPVALSDAVLASIQAEFDKLAEGHQ